MSDQARAQLEDSGRFLSSILDALPNPVFVKDEQHRWMLLNDAYCTFMGYPRSELLGKTDRDFFPRAEADVFWAKDDAVFASGELNENEESFTDARGREHVILTRKTLHVDLEGRRFLLGVITDITERKRMERDLVQAQRDLELRIRERTADLERANQRLEEQDRNKNEFLGVLSHELRNPLAPIRNALFLLEQLPGDSAQASRAREVMRRQTEHLTHLVDDLLDVTRISRGKIQLQREVTDLRNVVRSTCEDHRALFAESDIDLRLEFPVGPVQAEVDRTRIAQVVGNLLGNAQKFTPAGGTVTVALREQAGHAWIGVRDTGTGMEPDQVARMFEPFTQEDRSLARTRGGLGLGLALAKALVELHGGTITARSDGPGKGSAFELSLPLAPRTSRPATISAAALRGAKERRVLIIEDNLDAAHTLAAVLELIGHQVTVARDGWTGVALAREQKPDFVLCDLGLPDIDGYEVARLLRQDEGLRATRLIALSGYAQPEDQERAREAGFHAHLAKPVAIDALAELLG